MTYQNLLDRLLELEEDQLHMSVMIDVDDEFYTIETMSVQEKDDRLLDGHPYFEI